MHPTPEGNRDVSPNCDDFDYNFVRYRHFRTRENSTLELSLQPTGILFSCFSFETAAKYPIFFRRKGDPDDSSHRGHPLCQFCEVRFVDDEELFRHLRRDHYFCHFCDADGIQAYYPDYGMLKDHFKSGHFLCEEGECIDEQFTHAFRTELDLKAHRLERHKLNKAESRQNRQVDVDLSFKRRQPRGQGYVHTPVTSDQEVPDMTEDFPTLGGTKVSKSSASQGAKANGNMANRLASSTGRNWASVNQHSASFREADFPSLPGAPVAQPQPNGVPPSVRKKATKAQAPKETKPNPVLDFPSLPSTSQKQVHAFGPQYRRPNGYTPAWSNNQSDQEKPLDKGKKVAPAPDLDFPSLQQPSAASIKTEKKSKNVKKIESTPSELKPAPEARTFSSLRSAADLIFSSGSNATLNSDSIAEKENVSKVNLVKELPTNAKRLAKPPPGFGGNKHSVGKVIVRKLYMQPTDFNKRNAQLMSTIVQAFGGGKSLEFSRFKDLSHQYKENKIDSNNYLVQCSAILDNDVAKLETFMADLIVLLPQIDKQQVFS